MILPKKRTKNHLYRYTTPHESVICDSDGVTGDCITQQ
jgi:hypothetical protein